MGKRFLHSIALAAEDVPASTARQPFDLPVNPLSMVFLRFQITNANPSSSLVYSAIDDVITQITNVQITHKGESVVNASLRDLMVAMAVRHRLFPGWSVLNNANAGVRSLIFPICLGRSPYSARSCFPATSRGNLKMAFTAGADGSAYSDINVSVETVELLDASPEEYVKLTTLSRDSVVGQFDLDLPIGNPFLGLLLFDTGIGGSTDEVTSWGQVKLMMDNVEQYYVGNDIEVLAGLMNSQLKQLGVWVGHTHQVNAAGAGLEDADDADMPVSQGYLGYSYLDFDPTRDGEFLLETAGASRLWLRGNGDEATAIRALPLEIVKAK
jgi:hypothetical protein